MGAVSEWILGLDCATAWLSLALFDADGDAVERSAERLDRAMAGRLMPELAAFLERHGVRREDLSAIGVGVGPGSYTGIRIGVAAALGLGRSLGVPVAGSSTLEAIAFGALDEGETGWALVDARRGRVHALVATRLGRDQLGPVATPAGPATAATSRPLPAAAATALMPLIVEREALPADGWPRFEDLPPDASWHARRVTGGAPPEPRYG